MYLFNEASHFSLGIKWGDMSTHRIKPVCRHMVFPQPLALKSGMAPNEGGSRVVHHFHFTGEETEVQG